MPRATARAAREEQSMKRRGATVVRLLGLVAGFLAAAPPGAAADSTPPYTKISDQTTRATGLGPNRDQYCDVLYDLYVPNSASPSSPVPAILTTNGFGGSKDDQRSEERRVGKECRSRW